MKPPLRDAVIVVRPSPLPRRVTPVIRRPVAEPIGRVRTLVRHRVDVLGERRDAGQDHGPEREHAEADRRGGGQVGLHRRDPVQGTAGRPGDSHHIGGTSRPDARWGAGMPPRVAGAVGRAGYIPGMTTGLPGALAGLNDEQRAAAAHQGGPLLILAGAGTGKTRTLVARAAWLREQGVPASRILLLTFTRRAADDMLARARPPDAPAADRIWGGTFHAIAHRIIRAHAESFALPPEFSVIDPADVADVLDTLRAEHDLVGTRRRAPRAAACADIYTRCVNTGTPVAKVVKASYPWCADFVDPARRAVPGLRRAQAGARAGRLRRPAAAVAGGAGRPGGGPGAARAVRRRAGRRVPGRERRAGRHRPAAAARRRGPDLRRRRRAGHLRVPRRRPGAPARPGRAVPRPDGRAAGPQLPVPARDPAPGQRGPAAARGPGADPDRARRRRRRRGRGADGIGDPTRRGPAAGAGPLPRRGHPGARDLRAGAGRPRGRAAILRPGRAGPRGRAQRPAGDRAVGARHPVREVRRAALHRGGARQGLHRRRPGGGQPGGQPGLVPAAAAARGHRAGAGPPGHRRARPHRARRRWSGGPPRPTACRRGLRPAVSATVGQLIAAAAAGADGRPGRGHPGAPCTTR